MHVECLKPGLRLDGSYPVCCRSQWQILFLGTSSDHHVDSELERPNAAPVFFVHKRQLYFFPSSEHSRESIFRGNGEASGEAPSTSCTSTSAQIPCSHFGSLSCSTRLMYACSMLEPGSISRCVSVRALYLKDGNSEFGGQSFFFSESSILVSRSETPVKRSSIIF